MPPRPLCIAYLGVGSSPHVTRLAYDLAGRGHQVHVISEDRHGPFPDQPGVAFHAYPSTSRFPLRIAAVRALLRGIQPDVLHSHYLNIGGFVAAATNFHPHVMMAWGSDVFTVPHYSKSQYVKTVLALRAADWVLSPSSVMRQTLDGIAGKLRHNEVIQWGVDTDVFNLQGESQAMKAQLGLPPVPIVYSPRVLQPLYNQDRLIEAWPMVKRQISDVALVLKRINPDAEYEARLRARIRELGMENDVVWVEPTTYEMLPHYLRASDVIVSIPNSDGAPISVLEAMACGIPVVASDLPSLREWIEDDVNGRLTDPKNLTTLASSIVAMLRLSPAERLRVAERNHGLIRLRADREANLSRFEAIYYTLCRNQQSGFNPVATLGNLLQRAT